MSPIDERDTWIENCIFGSGVQWGDPPMTREEAEREWEARREYGRTHCPHCGSELKPLKP